jgi:hypothetical protein
MSREYREQLKREEEMPLAAYLEMIDQELEELELNYEIPRDRSILSEYCHCVGLNLYHRCAYDPLIRSTTRYLDLWKWWADYHEIDTSNFDEWWDYKFI